MRKIQRNAAVEVTSSASPEQIWPVLVDVTRLGAWSHEAREGQWLGDVAPATVGARFRARNRSGRNRWTRVSEVTVCRPATEFAWRTVPTLRYRDSTQWRVQLLPGANGGTRIEQSFRVLRLSRLMSFVFATFLPAHTDRREALLGDLHRLAALAEASSTPARSTS
jgi:hypothetical protein